MASPSELFGMLNPVLDSMRGLCATSHLERVQEEVCGRKVSLGSFSEAQGVFDPELLKSICRAVMPASRRAMRVRTRPTGTNRGKSTLPHVPSINHDEQFWA